MNYFDKLWHWSTTRRAEIVTEKNASLPRPFDTLRKVKNQVCVAVFQARGY